MADIAITVDGGTSKRLLTAGKYCDKNILVTATGGGSGGDPELPDDGKTRLYITVPANSMPGLPPPRNEVPLYIQQSVANGVIIDWGDGSDPETLPGTGKVNTTHTYQTAGDFVITLDPADGCELGLGHGSRGYCVMGNNETNGIVYCNMLKRVIIGSRGVGTVQTYAFSLCRSLEWVAFSDSVIKVLGNLFLNCSSLSLVKLSKNIVSISNSIFANCPSLASIIVPEKVNEIGSYSFSYCYGMKEYHFLSKNPPSLSNATDAFSGIPSDCIIYVPIGSLEAYQTATNWATYADQMQEEPA